MGGSGASESLTNVVHATAAEEEYLTQNVTAGNGGSSNNNLGGSAGNGSSILSARSQQRTKLFLCGLERHGRKWRQRRQRCREQRWNRQFAGIDHGDRLGASKFGRHRRERRRRYIRRRHGRNRGRRHGQRDCDEQRHGHRLLDGHRWKWWIGGSGCYWTRCPGGAATGTLTPTVTGNGEASGTLTVTGGNGRRRRRIGKRRRHRWGRQPRDLFRHHQWRSRLGGDLHRRERWCGFPKPQLAAMVPRKASTPPSPPTRPISRWSKTLPAETPETRMLKIQEPQATHHRVTPSQAKAPPSFRTSLERSMPPAEMGKRQHRCHRGRQFDRKHQLEPQRRCQRDRQRQSQRNRWTGGSVLNSGTGGAGGSSTASASATDTDISGGGSVVAASDCIGGNGGTGLGALGGAGGQRDCQRIWPGVGLDHRVPAQATVQGGNGGAAIAGGSGQAGAAGVISGVTGFTGSGTVSLSATGIAGSGGSGTFNASGGNGASETLSNVLSARHQESWILRRLPRAVMAEPPTAHIRVPERREFRGFHGHQRRVAGQRGLRINRRVWRLRLQRGFGAARRRRCDDNRQPDRYR